jgi:Family of unknown function (DUF5946)
MSRLRCLDHPGGTDLRGSVRPAARAGPFPPRALGPRHGLGFAGYALQHPSRFDRSTRERSWLILYRVYHEGDDQARLLGAIRRHPRPGPEAFGVPALSDRPEGDTFPMTIADLGSFEAARYADDLDAWCRSTLSALGAGGLPTGGSDASRGSE